MSLSARIEQTIGKGPVRLHPLSGGCVGEVYRADMADGSKMAVKTGGSGSGLAIEGAMLRYLADHSELPVPTVFHADDTLLLMSWIENSGALGPASQRHAADLLAALHCVKGEHYGHHEDALIGGLHQPNRPSESWLDFFREQRLLHMGHEAVKAGRLPSRTMARVEDLCWRLDEWIEEPKAPSLIHGDMWGGNVLVDGDTISGFIDPALYYADPEIELAFSTLFNTFNEPFFARYQEHRPLKPGFFEQRCDLYNLYPLLVHVRLFGGSYVGSVERTLAKFGF